MIHESYEQTQRVGSPPVAETTADVLIEELIHLGVDVFFGIPGGPVIPVFDAILRNSQATLIEPRHESHGVFEAMGFHRGNGRTACVVVTAGPGATNVVTGVVAAHLERVPLIVLCGDVPWESTGRILAQDTGPAGVGIERMLAGVTRAVVRIAHGRSVAGQLLAAVRAATQPSSPGPVLVVISVDKAGSHAPAPPEVYGVSAAASPPLLVPSHQLLETITGHIARSKRPLVIIGSGCRRAARQIEALVEVLGVPFVTTPQAKGIVSEEHPLSLRTCGMAASYWARRYMKQGIDLALVLGTDLDDASVAGTPPIGKAGILIHVDINPSVIGRNFPTRIAAVYDVGVFADALREMAGSQRPSPARAELLGALHAQSPFDAECFDSDPAFPIAPHRVLADLQRAAGPEATWVSDIGEHMLFALHYLTATGPDRFVLHLGLGSMASGIASAIGLALADRRRRIVCICGDGGMQMAGMELLVAIKHRLPIVYAVFNDARYNMVFHGYRHSYGREAPWDTPRIDFAAWAASIGALGVRIERAGEITPELLTELTAQGLPVVLDIRQDSSVRIKGDGRLEAIREMSMLHVPANRTCAACSEEVLA